MLSEDIFFQVQKNSFGLSNSALLSQLTIIKGKDVYLEDADGKQYIDLHAGPGVMSTGHSHPRLLQAIKKQLNSLIHCHDLASTARLELHEQLSKMLSGQPRRSAFLSGGAESIELALRLARGYTGRDGIIVFSGAFHGKTLGALACTDPMYRDNWWCKAPDVYRAPYAECYKCYQEHCQLHCGFEKAEQTIFQIEKNCSEIPAALLIEPAQGTAGNVFPSPGFLEKIFAYCRNKGILIIVDEILTGCGRTGRFLATEGITTEPDIIVLGKGLGSGYPIGAVLATETIAAANVANTVGSSSTSYGGNPLAAATAAATLRIIEDEDLICNSKRVGRLFLSGLKELAKQFDFINNVRGQGLMLGFDLDASMGTEIGKTLFTNCLKSGLMIMGIGNRVRINPPLTFSLNHVNESLDKLNLALKATEQSYRL
jgi:4-aminobutyrate aminotransferase-like enzyme